jgi:hypothetical protein
MVGLIEGVRCGIFGELGDKRLSTGERWSFAEFLRRPWVGAEAEPVPCDANRPPVRLRGALTILTLRLF